MDVQQILEATSGMTAGVLEDLAMKIADEANKKRKPNAGNRAFTFVSTYYDCEFPHPVFLEKELPTNEQALSMKLRVPVLGAATDQSSFATLEAAVHDAFGHPMANVRFSPNGDLKSCHWDSTNQKWRLDPD